jgi:urocanate hydratase
MPGTAFPRTIRAPRGTQLSCKGRQSEAVLRMLCSNVTSPAPGSL